MSYSAVVGVWGSDVRYCDVVVDVSDSNLNFCGEVVRG